MLLNCGFVEDSWESLGLQGDPTSHPKRNQSWVLIRRTDVKAETAMLWPSDAKSQLMGKDPDVGKDWGQEEKGMTVMRWLDGIPTQWTWVCVNSRSWWWTGKPGMLQSMGTQRVGHDWMTEFNWTAPWEKNYDNTRQHVKKQRCYFADKGPSSQAYDFSSSHVWIWELDHKECWVLKNAFDLWCWIRLLRVPGTARRSNQPIQKEISPEYSWEGLMLKLKFKYFGHLMQRTDSLEKTLMLGNIEGRRRRGQQRMRWLDGITDSMDEF